MTEEEAVLRERTAYAKALILEGGYGPRLAAEAAKAKYPLPKKLRIVNIPRPNGSYSSWKVVDGVLYCQTVPGGQWYKSGDTVFSSFGVMRAIDVLELAHLINNPTEPNYD